MFVDILYGVAVYRYMYIVLCPEKCEVPQRTTYGATFHSHVRSLSYNDKEVISKNLFPFDLHDPEKDQALLIFTDFPCTDKILFNISIYIQK